MRMIIPLNRGIRLLTLAFALLALAKPAFATTISGIVTGGTAATAGGIVVKLTPPLNRSFRHSCAIFGLSVTNCGRLVRHGSRA